jgi:AraC family ethanolamine operon transcriptional activator
MQYALTQNFDSFEAFNAFPSGWDTRFQLNHSQDCRARLEHSRGNGILVNTATLSGGTLQTGSTPRGMRTFALPLSLAGTLNWMGKKADDHSLLQFGSSEELFAVTAGGCSICTISLDSGMLDDMLALRGMDAESVFAAETAHALSIRERRMLLRDISLLSEFLSKYRRHDVMPTLSRGLQEALLDSLVDHLAAGADDDSPVRLDAAARLVRAVLTYMQDNPAGSDSIGEICDLLGTSRRSLELSFRKYVGVPPKRYLKMLRLDRCRETLARSAPQEASVGEIARRYGFWHMGQFARDYRALFDERPGETLARHP